MVWHYALLYGFHTLPNMLIKPLREAHGFVYVRPIPCTTPQVLLPLRKKHYTIKAGDTGATRALVFKWNSPYQPIHRTPVYCIIKWYCYYLVFHSAVYSDISLTSPTKYVNVISPSFHINFFVGIHVRFSLVFWTYRMINCRGVFRVNMPLYGLLQDGWAHDKEPWYGGCHCCDQRRISRPFLDEFIRFNWHCLQDSTRNSCIVTETSTPSIHFLTVSAIYYLILIRETKQNPLEKMSLFIIHPRLMCYKKRMKIYSWRIRRSRTRGIFSSGRWRKIR